MKDFKIGDPLIGPNGSKYKVTAVQDPYMIVELQEERDDLPKLLRLHFDEVTNYGEEKIND